MQNCYLIKQSNQSFEAFHKQSQKAKLESGLNSGIKKKPSELGEEETSEYLMHKRRPAARDGHSATVVMSDQHEAYLMIFGGDRHRMPYHDSFLLNLEAEIKEL